MTVDPKKYIDFVAQTTSRPSTYFEDLATRLAELEGTGADVPKLTTAAFGITAEAGEFAEVVKKIFLQGKPYNDDNIFHMKRELGDVMWYIMQVLMALNVDLTEVVEMNVEKLAKRYPGGEFDPYYSENRQEGDL